MAYQGYCSKQHLLEGPRVWPIKGTVVLKQHLLEGPRVWPIKGTVVSNTCLRVPGCGTVVSKYLHLLAVVNQ